MKKWKSIARVSIAFLGSVLAAGPLNGFPTVEPLLVKASLFYKGSGKIAKDEQMNELSLLYTVATGISVGLYAVIGWLYDYWGVRFSTTFGCVGVFVGLGMLAFSVSGHPHTQWLAWIAFPWADVSGFFNSMAVMGFIWHFPDHQSAILALGNATYSAGALMAFGLLGLSALGLSLPAGCTVFAYGGLVSALMLWFACPSPKEFYDRADAMLGTKSARQPANFFASIRDVFDVALQRPVDSALFVAGIFTAYVHLLFWFAVYEPYAVSLYGKATGAQVADALTLSYGVGGIVVTPFLGAIMDRMGVVPFYGLLSLAYLLFSVLVLFSSIYVQVISTLFGVLYLMSWSTFLSRWATIYAPPDLFGTYFGVIFSAAGLVQLAMNVVTNTVIQKAFPGNTGPWPYRAAFIFYGILANVLGISTYTAVVCQKNPLFHAIDLAKMKIKFLFNNYV